jgi:hypothetical protein
MAKTYLKKTITRLEGDKDVYEDVSKSWYPKLYFWSQKVLSKKGPFHTTLGNYIVSKIRPPSSLFTHPVKMANPTKH